MPFCYNAAMSDDPAPQVLDFLREQFARMHARFDRIEADIADIKICMSGQEVAMSLYLTEAGQSNDARGSDG